MLYEFTITALSLTWKIFCLCRCLTPTPVHISPLQIQLTLSQVCFLAHLPRAVAPTSVLGNALTIFHQDYWIIFFQEKRKYNVCIKPLPVNVSKESLSARVCLVLCFPTGPSSCSKPPFFETKVGRPAERRAARVRTSQAPASGLLSRAGFGFLLTFPGHRVGWQRLR